MRISEAARRLGTSARMLRYREDLGLLPQVRAPFPWLGGRSPRLGSAPAAGRLLPRLRLGDGHGILSDTIRTTRTTHALRPAPTFSVNVAFYRIDAVERHIH